MPFGFDIKKVNVVIERQKTNTNEQVFKRYLEEVRQHEVLSLITNVVHSHPDYATVRRPEFSRHMCALTIGGHPDEFDPPAYSALKDDASAEALRKAEEMYLEVLRYDLHACCTLCAINILCNLYVKYAVHFKGLKYRVIRRLSDMRRCIGGLMTFIRWHSLPIIEVTDVTAIQYYPDHLQSLILLEQAALRSKMVFLGNQRPAALATVEHLHFEDLLIVAALAQMSVIDSLILAVFSYVQVATRMRIKLPTPFVAVPATSHFGLTHMITTKNSTITTIAANNMSYMPILKLYVEDVDINSIGSLYTSCVEILTRLFDTVVNLEPLPADQLHTLNDYDRQLHSHP